MCRLAKVGISFPKSAPLRYSKAATVQYTKAASSHFMTTQTKLLLGAKEPLVVHIRNGVPPFHSPADASPCTQQPFPLHSLDHFPGINKMVSILSSIERIVMIFPNASLIAPCYPRYIGLTGYSCAKVRDTDTWGHGGNIQYKIGILPQYGQNTPIFIIFYIFFLI